MFKQLSHLLCFFCPVLVLSFLISGPHNAGAALAWTVPLCLMIVLDWLGPKLDSQQTYPVFSEFYYSGILYCLALIQLINILLMLFYVSQLQWHSQAQVMTGLVNLLALRFLVGTSSGISGIIVAHELSHRRQPFMRLLARLLLCSVCYDHFTFAHHYGHHPRVAKPHDISTARRGESFQHYWKRVIVEDFRFAWVSETIRLKRHAQPVFKHRVLQGVIFEISSILVICYYFGWLASLLFLYQAFVAVRILEAINYFQHWGLERQDSKGTLAWVSDSWLSWAVLLALPYHINHHRNGRQHFQKLTYCTQGPKLPYGYFVMNLWVKLNNRSFRQSALQELQHFTKKDITGDD